MIAIVYKHIFDDCWCDIVCPAAAMERLGSSHEPESSWELLYRAKSSRPEAVRDPRVESAAFGARGAAYVVEQLSSSLEPAPQSLVEDLAV